MRLKTRRLPLAIILFLLGMTALPAVSQAQVCGDCQVCRQSFTGQFCDIADTEDGRMCCAENYMPFDDITMPPITACSLSGEYCFGIIVRDV